MKPIVVTICGQDHLRKDWYFDFAGEAFSSFINTLTEDMQRLGIAVQVVQRPEQVIAINSYADLLNSIKISSPQDNHHNQCVGHIIDKSEHLDIMEDISRAVRRIAFAPETIAPESAFRKVCHNCGCGC